MPHSVQVRGNFVLPAARQENWANSKRDRSANFIGVYDQASVVIIRQIALQFALHSAPQIALYFALLFEQRWPKSGRNAGASTFRVGISTLIFALFKYFNSLWHIAPDLKSKFPLKSPVRLRKQPAKVGEGFFEHHFRNVFKANHN